jgi:tetraacyldisaccharide 4'-kinase
VVLSGLFALAVALRNLLYELGWLRVRRIPGVQVVSVGNLNVGGAGKTPAVIYLANALTRAGRRVGVVTRGYGRESRTDVVLSPGAPLPSADVAGDEPLLIARRCPGVHVLISRDRARFAEAHARELGLDTLVLDDGFQHRALARDVDVVAVDQASGLGNGRLLPWGPLREPPSALQRATAIWLRNTEVEGAKVDGTAGLPALGAAIERAVAGRPVLRAKYLPRGWVSPMTGELAPLSALEGRELIALSGIARPEAFERTLVGLGLQVRRHVAVRDHGPFARDVLAELAAEAEACGAVLVTTEKDAARLPAGVQVWQLRMDVELPQSGVEALRELLGL